MQFFKLHKQSQSDFLKNSFLNLPLNFTTLESLDYTLYIDRLWKRNKMFLKLLNTFKQHPIHINVNRALNSNKKYQQVQRKKVKFHKIFKRKIQS